MSQIEFLHILRGCAALLVALEHLCIVFWYSKAAVTSLTNLPAVPDTVPPPLSTRLVFSFVYEPLSPRFSLGMFSVALFYLISGFVIPFSLRKTALPGFLAARALRLWPTYAAGLTLALLSVAIGSAVENTPFPHGYRDILSNYCLGMRDVLRAPSLDGIVHTLEIEIKFYILLALCASMVRERKVALFRIVAPALCALVFAYSILAKVVSPRQAFFFQVGCKLASDFRFVIFLLIGTVFNYHFDGSADKREATKHVFVLFVLSSACSFGLDAYEIAVQQTFCNGKALALFACCYVFREQFVGASSFALTKLADISYSLYVTHGVFGYTLMNLLVRRFHASPDVSFAIAFVSCLFVASVLHRYVESPTQRMASKISSRWRLQPSPSSSAGCVMLPRRCKDVVKEVVCK
jgi:peptidoglycan/LPS O-acetylase OafA/YrhL